MSITLKTRKMLWGRAANRCSICRRELVLDTNETDDLSLIGDECHIVAKKPDGPRGEAPLSSEQRDKYGNLLILCKVHHKQIDDQPDEFTVEKLIEIKATHEQWVRESLQGYDPQKQHDDEIYASYIEGWEKLANLEHWTGWTSWILSAGQPQLPLEVDTEINKLRTWLLSRIWPKRYEELEASFENFRCVLHDFHETFYKHAQPWGKDALTTHKFYRIKEWNPERYRQLTREYNFHVDLVQDLMLELTRAANYTCDMVRRFIFPSYRLSEGVLLVESGMYMDMSYVTHRSEYRAAERVLYPYPGLKQFLVDRKNRDLSFGVGIDTNDSEFIEHLAKPPFDFE